MQRASLQKIRYPRCRIERQLYIINALCETHVIYKKNFRLFLRDFSSEIKRTVYMPDRKLSFGWPNACNLFPHRAGGCFEFSKFCRDN